MFSEKDKSQFAEKGIELTEIEGQLNSFRKGFPSLSLSKPALLQDGIMAVSDSDLNAYANRYGEALPGLRVIKFVPASGAATRMFKSLYECYHYLKSHPDNVEECLTKKELQPVKQFFDKLGSFAFYQDLKELYRRRNEELENELSVTRKIELLEDVLFEKGLAIGSLPKGLIKFHDYPDGARTSLEEHMVEGAGYARNKDNSVNIHLTVSPEHMKGFKKRFEETHFRYEKWLGVRFHMDYSVQKSSTDTIAVDLDNQPFRDNDGSILFRPGGHGALLENLDEIDADIIFIKNIDNVVPDWLKDTTILYKKVLAGILIEYQERIFSYLQYLDEKETGDEKTMDEIGRFLEQELCVMPPIGLEHLSGSEKREYFRNKLNRPVRVCGMVRNEGEPGGGPFWARNADGTVSLQVVESSQIDFENEDQKNKFLQATHFNPVDLVCGVRDYRGEKFNLLHFRDPKTGFISKKSKDGRDLKALELPGLWNGAMSDWNTLFVEVPIETFNPVKTINDLLRPQHQ